ncbi:MAG: DUF72 domain-containing protein [Candidatus Lokiarchaeota archaeon]|nr:DUF72 domain-containing protein [Candidatus Lokiarchaeota archaeon]
MNAMIDGLHIGTSGWSYKDDWKGIFYHSGSALLRQYLSYFDTAEINSTFYALPKPSFIRYLADAIPESKFFTAKLPRDVTHDHRLRLNGAAGEVLQRFFKLMKPLGNKLQALLIQLPPWKKSSMGNLEAFLSALDESYRYAIEFRHRSWLEKKTWSLLEDYNIANVVVDEPKLPIDLRTTTDFTYIRWHGHGQNPWYDYLYSVEELKDWVPRLHNLQEKVDSVLGYFNNHFAGNAPLNAFQMLRILGRITERQEMKLERMLQYTSVEQTSIDEF